MLVSNLSYSQYPILKKLGSDSVVIITLKQANQVNKYYLDKENEVAVLKDSIFMQNLLSDAQYRYSLFLESEYKKKSTESSSELVKYYEEREKMWESKVRKHARTNVYIFIATTLLLFVKF